MAKTTKPKRRARVAKRPVRARKRTKSSAASRRQRSHAAAARARRRPIRRAKPVRRPIRRAKPVRRPIRRARPVRRPTAPRPSRRRSAGKRPASPRPISRKIAAVARVSRLERDRRRLPELERLEPLREMTDARMIAAARAGHDELKAQLQRHTETSPKLTAGDVDAKWEDAYAVGDEAPGGDNPTPDQDRVDDIGKALGVQYQDNEELKGGEEITERDQHRWELDPASSDDWPHKE